MKKGNLENATQEGPPRWESLRAAAAARSPTYSGGGTKCSKAEREKEEEGGVLDSDDSSCMSHASLSSLSNERRKRGRPRLRKSGESGSNSDSGSDAPATKVYVMKPQRGRGRPPTTGQYVGLAKAKAELVAAKRAEMELQAEQEVAEMARKQRQERPTTSRQTAVSEAREGEPTAHDLSRRVLDSVTMIELVATKSRNLKGTFVRALKDAATSIKEAVEDLKGRSSTDETNRLQAANVRLQAEVAELRREMVELRQEVAKAQNSPTPRFSERLLPSRIEASGSSAQELIQEVMRQVGGMVGARFEALEERLLPERRARPPLAADRRTPAAAAASVAVMDPRKRFRKVPTPEPQPGPSEMLAVMDLTPPSLPAPKGKKGKSTTGRDGPQTAKVQPGVSWVEVAKRGRKKKKVGTAAIPAPPQGQKPQAKAAQPRQTRVKTGAKPRLRAPKTAAVVLTILPAGADKGVSYAKALIEAKRRINLADLGIAALGFRQAVTGARMLEVAGDESGQKADLLAEKLRQIFRDDEVRVTRPVKSVDMRVTGLDDSVTGRDVAEAVARVGDCQPDAVKAREIRRNAAGLGTVFVRCPVSAAKKVTTEGRLLVGWVSAQVKLLTPKPLRCFRCLEVGHVRQQCTAETDRSTMCFRCGQSGHKAGDCSAEPHCVLCANAGKPAGHRMGGGACVRPPKKKAPRGKVAAAAKKTSAKVCPPAPRGGEGASAQILLGVASGH